MDNRAEGANFFLGHMSVKKAPPDKKAPPLNSRKILKGGGFLNTNTSDGDE